MTNANKWNVERVRFSGRPEMVAGYRAVRARADGGQDYLVARGRKVLIGEAQSQHQVEANATLVATETQAWAMVRRAEVERLAAESAS